MADGQCILVCRDCGDGDLPMPFSSYRERGKWAAGHTEGTGHSNWYCVDGWPSPERVTELLAAHDESARALREMGFRAYISRAE